MAKTSSGVIIARIVVVLIILGIIGACLYFFVIKNDNVRGHVYEEITTTLNSDNQKTFESNIGSQIENGTYYNYSQNLSDDDAKLYKSIYLSYYMDKEILDTYVDLLVYVGNTDNAKLQKINEKVSTYTTKLKTAVESQSRFNASYEANAGAIVPAVSADFKIFVNDFKSLQEVFHQITSETFDYVTKNYYKNVNAFLSQKYAQTYALNAQSNVLNNKISAGFSDTVYSDSKALVNAYVGFKSSNFTAQSTNTDVSDYITLVANMQNDFSEFYNAESKSAYYSSSSDELKEKLVILARGLGISGRL